MIYIFVFYYTFQNDQKCYLVELDDDLSKNKEIALQMKDFLLRKGCRVMGISMKYEDRWDEQGNPIKENSNDILIQNFVLQNYFRAQDRNFFLTYRKSRNHLQALTKMNAFHITEFGSYATKLAYSEGDRETEDSRLDRYTNFFAKKHIKNHIYNRIAILGLRCDTSNEILEDLRKQMIYDGQYEALSTISIKEGPI
jgi:hypothetical protein